MDSGIHDFSERRSYDRVLDPDARLKLVTQYGDSVDIDSNIPPRRYYRSGLEMVRMANMYLEEGSLENAFILYLKFMTLFIEKIRTHPDFNTVPTDLKVINSQKLREVIPKAENLKKKLLVQYKKEYEKFVKDMNRRDEIERERRRLQREEKSKLIKPESIVPPILASAADSSKMSHVIPVPPLLDDLNYPSEALSSGSTSNTKIAESRSPGVDRTTKPASLLSPTYIRQSLRTVIVPNNLMQKFLQLAQRNTDRNVETCGILAGQMRLDQLVISHLLVPEQTGTCDSCTTQREEDLFDYQDQHDLITFGWIHTHPTQTAFLSSVDLHTHCSYQRMMPEAIAIVCAPRYAENMFFCLTPDYGLDYIANCNQSGFHPHPSDPELFMVAEHYKIDPKSSVQVVDLRR